MSADTDRLAIVVLGASGDLARRKLFPALFALHCQGLLPDEFRLFGFARSELDDRAFRERITEHLTCRYAPGESCDERMSEFLERCHYAAGQYDAPDDFLDLYARMRETEHGRPTPRVFYLAVPPSVFVDAARAIGDSGLVSCTRNEPWSRVVIEKPFGRDRASSDRLTRELANVFTEDQVYRIDHYLGKEVIQNLMVLRFANLIFEPLWNRDYIESVEISWEEDLAIEGRGGYFDRYGIIRDVVQNHLLQILALVAMEQPISLAAHDVRDEKVKVLRCVQPPAARDIVIGQYTAGKLRGRTYPGYREDPTVADDSLTPTFAAVSLRVRNRRWDGIPFLIRAGKGLSARKTEIRVRFRHVPSNIFHRGAAAPDPNELVIRVQPDEAINCRIVNKLPGPGMRLESRTLDLRYQAAFDELIPDAYESLLLDVLRGEKGLFIRNDELAAAWDVFTPMLRELEAGNVEPASYPFGSAGPDLAGGPERAVG